MRKWLASLLIRWGLKKARAPGTRRGEPYRPSFKWFWLAHRNHRFITIVAGPYSLGEALAERQGRNCGRKYHPCVVVDRHNRIVRSIPRKAG